MTPRDIARARMYTQHISTQAATPAEVVRHLGALQAQDYLAALWAVGLRTRGGTEAAVEKALNAGLFLRTWPMRGTLHFVDSSDAEWMLKLLTPRGISRSRSREHELHVDAAVLKRSAQILIHALSGGRALSRPAIYAVFEKEGLPHKNSAGLHILGHLAMDQLICFGPRQGKQHTFVLFNEWVKKTKTLEGVEAFAELAIRYCESHGPVQLIDLCWWAGLTKKEAETGFETAGKKIRREIVDGKTYYIPSSLKETSKPDETAYLLPPFDEFLVGYKDRSASLEATHAQHVNPGANGMFSGIVVVDGQVLGTWKRTLKKNAASVTTTPFVTFSKLQKEAVAEAIEKYTAFLGISSRSA